MELKLINIWFVDIDGAPPQVQRSAIIARRSTQWLAIGQGMIVADSLTSKETLDFSSFVF